MADKRKAEIDAADANVSGAKKSRGHLAAQSATKETPVDVAPRNHQSGTASQKQNSAPRASHGSNQRNNTCGAGATNNAPASFADVMRNRPTGAPKLSKSEKKKMRKAWKKAQSRKARGLEADDEAGLEHPQLRYRKSNASGRQGSRRSRRQAKQRQHNAGDGDDDSELEVGRLASLFRTAKDLVTAQGICVRALGRVLGHEWTGEEMQKVMVLYTHIFVTAMLSNWLPAPGQISRTLGFEDVGLLLTFVLSLIGVLSVFVPVQKLLAGQSIVFISAQFISAFGILDAFPAISQHLNMSALGLVLCINTLVVAAIGVARLGTTAAVTYGCLGFVPALYLGRLLGCHFPVVLDVAVSKYVVVLAYAVFSFKARDIDDDDDDHHVTGSLQVFRSKTDHRTDENGSAIEACYNVEELEEPVHTAISTLCSSIQKVISNQELLHVNLFLFSAVAAVAQPLLQSDTDSSQPADETPWHVALGGHIVVLVLPAVVILLAKKTLTLAQTIQVVVFGILVALKAAVDSPTQPLHANLSVALIISLAVSIFELTTRLESRRRIGLALVLQLFVAKGFTIVVEKTLPFLFPFPLNTPFALAIVAFVFSLSKLNPLIRELRYNTAILDE